MYKYGIIIILLVTIVFSQEKERLKDVLGLTPQQSEEFAKLKKASFSRDSVHFAKLEKLRGSLFDELSKENVDFEKINKIASDIGKVHSDLSLCMSANIGEIKKILTSVQFEKFIEFNRKKVRKGGGVQKEY